MSLGNPSFKARHWFYRWHRRIGIVSAVFVVVLLVTGILLNHTEALQLDNRHSSSSILRTIYGLPDNLDIQIATAGKTLISQFQDTIYFNSQPTEDCQTELVGAIELHQLAGFDSTMLVACRDGLLWLDGTGEYLDFIPAISFNVAEITTIGVNSAEQAVINDGTAVLHIDLENLTSTAGSRTDVSWSHLQTADSDTTRQLNNAYYREAISWEQILLDMHSGRLFGGNFGVLLMDASAVILLLLVLSGLYMWWVKPS